MSTVPPLHDQPVQSGAATPPSVALGPDHWAITLSTPSQISEVALDWDELAACAAEPNVFYERWQFESAWTTFRELDVVVAIYRRGRTKADSPTLIGLFPTVRRQTPSRWLGWRAELWTHPYGFLRTPLLRRGSCLEAIDLWTRAVSLIWPDIDLAVWERMHGEGPVHHALTDWLRRTGCRSVTTQRYNRAVCVPRSGTYDDYIEHAVSKKQRRELSRQRRRLEEIGLLTYTRPANDHEVDLFTDSFLDLEVAGWKGENESAIAADETHSAYFRAIIRNAWTNDQLDAGELRLDGKPIASKLSFVSCDHAKQRVGFACKIAYRESLAKFSPGVLLELETIRHLHETNMCDRIDSCAAPDHPMIDRLWSERVQMQHVAFALPNARLSTRLRLATLAARLLRRPVNQSPSVMTANY